MTECLAILKTRTTNILCLCSSIPYVVGNKSKKQNNNNNNNNFKNEINEKRKMST
jgi:hypothetical protein